MTERTGSDISPLAVSTSRNPRGWFQVAWSDTIAPGEVKTLHYFGEELVAFRTRSGKLSVLDAYCQHLGAHLGVRGTVEGEEIKCPWHGWQWGTDGCNTLIPYSADQKQTKVRIKSWPVREWYGIVLIWHDAEGGEPQWEPPKVAELESAEWYPITEDSRVVHRIKAHPQMVLENAADPYHVPYVHGGSENPEVKWFEFDKHEFQAEVAITYGGGKPSTWLTPNGPVRAAVRYHQVGIGQGFVRWPDEILPTLQVSNVTPVDDVYSDYWFCQTSVREEGDTGDLMTGRAKKLLELQKIVITQDFFTWENMKYLAKPNFATEEARDYSGVRRWAHQFYPVDAQPTAMLESRTGKPTS